MNIYLPLTAPELARSSACFEYHQPRARLDGPQKYRASHHFGAPIFVR